MLMVDEQLSAMIFPFYVAFENKKNYIYMRKLKG